MFKSKKKKTSFDPVSSIQSQVRDAADQDIGQVLDDPELYTEHHHEQRCVCFCSVIILFASALPDDALSSRSHYQEMSRSNPQQILNKLASSSNDFASGIAICIKALAEATASPPATPIVIEYRNRRMAFGRRSLSRMDGYVWFISLFP